MIDFAAVASAVISSSTMVGGTVSPQPQRKYRVRMMDLGGLDDEPGKKDDFRKLTNVFQCHFTRSAPELAVDLKSKDGRITGTVRPGGNKVVDAQGEAVILEFWQRISVWHRWTGWPVSVVTPGRLCQFMVERVNADLFGGYTRATEWMVSRGSAPNRGAVVIRCLAIRYSSPEELKARLPDPNHVVYDPHGLRHNPYNRVGRFIRAAFRLCKPSHHPSPLLARIDPCRRLRRTPHGSRAVATRPAIPSRFGLTRRRPSCVRHAVADGSAGD